MCFCLCVPKLCCFPSILCPCLSCLPMCVKGLKCCQCLVVSLEPDAEKTSDQKRESQTSSHRPDSDQSKLNKDLLQSRISQHRDSKLSEYSQRRESRFSKDSRQKFILEPRTQRKDSQRIFPNQFNSRRESQPSSSRTESQQSRVSWRTDFQKFVDSQRQKMENTDSQLQASMVQRRESFSRPQQTETRQPLHIKEMVPQARDLQGKDSELSLVLRHKQSQLSRVTQRTEEQSSDSDMQSITQPHYKDSDGQMDLHRMKSQQPLHSRDLLVSPKVDSQTPTQRASKHGKDTQPKDLKQSDSKTKDFQLSSVTHRKGSEQSQMPEHRDSRYLKDISQKNFAQTSHSQHRDSQQATTSKATESREKVRSQQDIASGKEKESDKQRQLDKKKKKEERRESQNTKRDEDDYDEMLKHK